MADGGFDDAVRRGDLDRWLASRFIADRGQRADVVALYAFDLELERAQRVTSSPLTAEIRMAWWSEALGDIFGAGRKPSHPVAAALQDLIRRRSLPRPLLETLIEARRERLFSAVADGEGALAWADKVAGSMALLAARVLDPEAPQDPVRLGGRAFGLGQLIRSGALAPQIGAPLLQQSLAQANAALSGLSARAFPAVAAATLARHRRSDGQLSEISQQLRLVVAVARGRL